MEVVFRAVAVLGMLWSFLLSWLICAVQDSWIRGMGYVCILLPIFLTVFARLYSLHRWAAIAVCLYCASTTFNTLSSGIWQWTLTWSLLTITLAILTAVYWRTLRSGL